MSVTPLKPRDGHDRETLALKFEILEALTALGGSAHMRALADVIAAERRSRAATIGTGILQSMLHTLLEQERLAEGGFKSLFFRPFGPDSMRIAVVPAEAPVPPPALHTEAIDALLQSVGAMARTADHIDQARRTAARVLSAGEPLAGKSGDIANEFSAPNKVVNLRSRTRRTKADSPPSRSLPPSSALEKGAVLSPNVDTAPPQSLA